MTTAPVRVGLVGCGRIARTHARYVRGLSTAQLVAVCDPLESAANSLGDEFKVEARYVDLRKMLAEARLDALHVITPPATHADVAITAMEAGVHVLVEKPMAIDRSQADRMVSAAQRTGRTLVVDHNRWFDPVVQRARNLLASGALGELVGVDVVQSAAVDDVQAVASGNRRHWSADLPGGVMHDLAPHPAYLLRNFVGPISEVHVTRLKEGEVVQELRAVVRGERCLGTMTISLRGRPFTNTVRLVGSRKTVDVNLNNMTLVLRQERKVPKLVGKVLPNLEEAAQLVVATVVNGIAFATGRQRYFPGMGILMRQFYLHLAAGSPPPTTGEEGADVVSLLDALWQPSTEPERRRALA
jgi:2-alkyl-3-oxoalkanoate reductase